MSLHAARGGEHVTIELSCRTCPYTPRGVAGKQGSHGKEHETEKENNNKITNEIDIEKGNILIALQNMFGMFLRSLHKDSYIYFACRKLAVQAIHSLVHRL